MHVDETVNAIVILV